MDKFEKAAESIEKWAMGGGPFRAMSDKDLLKWAAGCFRACSVITDIVNGPEKSRDQRQLIMGVLESVYVNFNGEVKNDVAVSPQPLGTIDTPGAEDH